LELALACTYRVGADDPSLSLGLPEVLLGLHPGFGGTVRTVQLIGVRPALDLMLKGKPYWVRALWRWAWSTNSCLPRSCESTQGTAPVSAAPINRAVRR